MNIHTLTGFMAAAVMTLVPLTAAAQDKVPVERFALYVASNKGGAGRETLRYAGSDASKLAQTMSEIGGVSASNSMILVDPAKSDIDKAFASFSDSIKKGGLRARRTEFVFYYSGHSDETSLLLGDDRYDYSLLKAELGKVPSDVHVVMLDSCFSGNFVRAKGGTRQKPFLMDDSTVVQGHAYLSSSSAHEASQESDDIQASFFTHALITGLRGAADSSGDKKVSLNELYYYAFNQTLSKTESTTVGPQHPSYNITLVGSGDLVLTDIEDAESLLIIPSELEGNCFIRNTTGVLVSEVRKIRGTEVALALPAGFYTVAIVTSKATTQTSVQLVKNQKAVLENESFTIVPKIYGRPRGDSAQAYDEAQQASQNALANMDDDDWSTYDLEYDDFDDFSQFERETDSRDASAELNSDQRTNAAFPPASTTWTPISVTIFPGWRMPDPSADHVNISASAFMAIDKHVNGMHLSPFMNSTSGSLRGLQAAGFMNISTGPLNAVQAAGFMNIANGAGPLDGVQAAGFMNVTNRDMRGVQAAGFMNRAGGSFEGIQAASFMNVAKDRFEGVQASNFLNVVGQDSDLFQISGFLNIAKSMKGMQIGIINIAEENTGVSLGILNFIESGLMSPAYFQDSEGNAFIQYQGGTPSFFTTFLVGTKANWGNEWDWDYGFAGFGIGTRLGYGNFLCFDVELLNTLVIDTGRYDEAYKRIPMIDTSAPISEEDMENHVDAIAAVFKGMNIPSLRITANAYFSKHLSVFASYNMNMKIQGYNNEAFEYGTHSNPYTLSDKAKLYFSWSFGIRF